VKPLAAEAKMTAERARELNFMVLVVCWMEETLAGGDDLDHSRKMASWRKDHQSSSSQKMRVKAKARDKCVCKRLTFVDLLRGWSTRFSFFCVASTFPTRD